jgi:hypothetical protein
MLADHVEPLAVPCHTGFPQQRISAMFLEPFVDIVERPVWVVGINGSLLMQLHMVNPPALLLLGTLTIPPKF